MGDMDQQPSFSLGLDFETNSYPLPEPSTGFDPNPDPAPGRPSKDINALLVEEEEELEDVVMDSDNETRPNPARILKRLRRGGVKEREEEKEKEKESGFCCDVVDDDDDIEEFSSPGDFLVRDACQRTQYNSVCSSSKVSLSGRGVMTTQSSSKLKAAKVDRGLDAPVSSSLERGSSGMMFPKLTISPLRRYQLIDSDSDSDSNTKDPSASKSVVTASKQIDSASKQQMPTINEQKRKSLPPKVENNDLWKDFSSVRSHRIPTPALDEFCDEYFQSLQNKSADHKMKSESRTSYGTGHDQKVNMDCSVGLDKCQNSTDPRPPSHQYFFHEDLRIRTLVRSRLPNFAPLGITDHRENQQPRDYDIDYMCQFKGEASKQKGARKRNGDGGSDRKGRKSNKHLREKADASEGWVDPRSSTSAPKDAGKRRVHASGQAAGHWYTSPEGRKVYVSKNGQEFSGQGAYRCYRKESGEFRKSKTKTSAKRKKAKS